MREKAMKHISKFILLISLVTIITITASPNDDESIKTLTAMLKEKVGDDAAYSLLRKDSQKVIKVMDELVEEDKFNERYQDYIVRYRNLSKKKTSNFRKLYTYGSMFLGTAIGLVYALLTDWENYCEDQYGENYCAQ